MDGRGSGRMSASCRDCRTPTGLSWNKTFSKSRKEALGSLIWDRQMEERPGQR